MVQPGAVPNKNLWELVDRAAARFPDHLACTDDEASLTYLELQRCAQQLGAWLVGQGVKPGDRVALMMSRSVNAFVSVYGALCADAVLVPIDPAAASGTATDILTQCNAVTLLCDLKPRALTRLLESGAQIQRIVCTVEAQQAAKNRLPNSCLTWVELRSLPVGNHSPSATSQDLAYIIFTSGSTGRPKGIMHSHSSGLSYARLAQETYGVSDSDRIASFAPWHVDQCTLALFCAPLAGASVALVPNSMLAFPFDLARWLADELISIWYSVPLPLVMMLERGELLNVSVPKLRWVTYGGEVFPIGQLRELMSYWPQARFSNVYGPAEVNQCTYHHLTLRDLDTDDPVPIGTVWDDTHALVLDEDGGVAPTGEIGELVVMSPTQMQGYWRQPELTAKAFVQLSDAPVPGRYYRTGDLMFYDAQGLLHFVGRKDRQIKLRGTRVELEGVEAVLASHVAVLEAAVYVVAKPAQAPRLLASVLLRDGHAVLSQELRKFAGARLANVAVPEQIFIESTFPRAGGGKADRNALAQRHSN